MTLHVRFLGDQYKSKSLKWLGLNQIDILKTQMSFQGLKQCRRMLTLPDGTVFDVTINHNEEILKIYTPVIQPEIVLEAEEAAGFTANVICFTIQPHDRPRNWDIRDCTYVLMLDAETLSPAEGILDDNGVAIEQWPVLASRLVYLISLGVLRNGIPLPEGESDPDIEYAAAYTNFPSITTSPWIGDPYAHIVQIDSDPALPGLEDVSFKPMQCVYTNTDFWSGHVDKSWEVPLTSDAETYWLEDSDYIQEYFESYTGELERTETDTTQNYYYDGELIGIMVIRSVGSETYHADVNPVLLETALWSESYSYYYKYLADLSCYPYEQTYRRETTNPRGTHFCHWFITELDFSEDYDFSWTHGITDNNPPSLYIDAKNHSSTVDVEAKYYGYIDPSTPMLQINSDFSFTRLRAGVEAPTNVTIEENNVVYDCGSTDDFNSFPWRLPQGCIVPTDHIRADLDELDDYLDLGRDRLVIGNFIVRGGTLYHVNYNVHYIIVATVTENRETYNSTLGGYHEIESREINERLISVHASHVYDESVSFDGFTVSQESLQRSASLEGQLTALVTSWLDTFGDPNKGYFRPFWVGASMGEFTRERMLEGVDTGIMPIR